MSVGGTRAVAAGAVCDVDEEGGGTLDDGIAGGRRHRLQARQAQGDWRPHRSRSGPRRLCGGVRPGVGGLSGAPTDAGHVWGVSPLPAIRIAVLVRESSEDSRTLPRFETTAAPAAVLHPCLDLSGPRPQTLNPNS